MAESISLSKTGIFNEKQLKTLSRRGIRNIENLLYYFPRRYIDRSKPLDFKSVQQGDVVTFVATVASSEVKYGRKRRLSVILIYQGFHIEMVFFQGLAYYSRTFKPGMTAAFSGKLDFFRGKYTITHPEFEVFSGDELIHTGKIIPIYKLTDSMRTNFITSRTLRQAVHQLLEQYSPQIPEFLDAAILQKEKMLSLGASLLQMHFPDSFEMLDQAKKRLAFNELIVFSAFILMKKQERRKIQRPYPLQNPSHNWSSDMIKQLPFQLTHDQNKAIKRLEELSQMPYPYSALLQGDVGSGKTLVALATALNYMSCDIQTALMAPTEILARQHYQNFLNYLSSMPFVPIDILLGAEKAGERKAKLERIKRGDTLLMIGTHALIQKDIEFKNLALVIIDEQHRFGVEQREELRSKGVYPDFLTMTATPIPRSLTLTLYGDLEPIIIAEKPVGRLKVDTRLFYENDLERLYKGVKKYVDQGRQAYIIYPLIEESESGQDWPAIMSDFADLEKKHFAGYRLGLLHGKLSADEKERAMQKFKEGLIQILVSTTVVEVGVDVPNATVMMIRNADKFGLSQLHQLRGRVGRSNLQSFCILIASDQITEDAKERLNAMLLSDDGFFLAKKDFEIRGAGELLGLKQSGISEFRLADLRIHSDLAEKAVLYLEENPFIFNKITGLKNWEKQLTQGIHLFAT